MSLVGARAAAFAVVLAACDRDCGESRARAAGTSAAARDASAEAEAEVAVAPDDAAGDAATAAAHPPGPAPMLEVQEVAETGRWPKGAVLSHDGATLYVTNFGELGKTRNVSVYDARTLDSRGEFDVGAEVVEAVLSPDDATLYLSSFWGHSVLFLDVATRRVTREVKAGAHPKVLALTKDGAQLFSANWSGDSVTQIDVASGTVSRTLATGKSPRGMVVTSKGTLYVASFYGAAVDVFDGPELERRRRFEVCRCPRHLALSPDERTLYVSCLYRSKLHAIDLATATLAHEVAIGESPKSVAVSPDGRYVYSADYGLSRSVSVVDTSDWSVRVFSVPGMDRGSGVAVAPDGEHAYVTGWYDGHVYLVGFVGTGGHPEEAKRKIAGWLHRPKSRDPGDRP